MRGNAHQELTDEENEKVLGTLTHEAWVGTSVEDIASEWYRLDTEPEYLLDLPNPSERLVHVARISSGSIEGQHRKDLKEAIIGSPAQQSNLSVPIMNMPAPAPQVDARPPRRGF